MPPLGAPLRFLCDEDVPASVTEFLRQRGHFVATVTELTIDGESDEVVVRLAHQLSLQYDSPITLVTFNRNHFATLIPRRPPDNQLRYRRVGRLTLAVDRAAALTRLTALIDDIEREHYHCLTARDQRCLLTLQTIGLLIER